ncbi:MAG: T9SS C-terminal target domain-containing protein [Bacteroidetes bacterium]|nr:MAG: T9SS C-terminal target domain-containing protein [Bacteroidota bacterium]
MRNFKSILKNRFSIRIAILFYLLSTQFSNAQLLAYEGFSVPGATFIQGSNVSGFGFQSGWQQASNEGFAYTNTSPLLVSGLLSNDFYLTAGRNFQGAGRVLDNSFTGPFASYFESGDNSNGSRNIGNQSGTTLYISFVIQKTVNNQNESKITFHDQNNPTDDGGATQSKSFGFGYYDAARSEDSGIKYWTLRIGNSYVKTTKELVVGETIFAVLKVDFASTSTITAFINPNKSSFGLANAPNVSTIVSSTNDKISFKSIHIYADQANQLLIDEFRFGSTWADVTPAVPIVSISGVNVTASTNAINTPGGKSTLSGLVFPSSATSPIITTWISSNPSLASVSTNGIVTPIKNGIVTITGTFTNSVNSVSGMSVITITNQPIPPLLAYEGFSVPGATFIQGSNVSGFGFSAAWAQASSNGFAYANANPLVIPGLQSSDFYMSAGQNFEGAGRKFDNGYTGPFSGYFDASEQFNNNRNIGSQNGKTLFISFIISKTVENQNESKITFHDQNNPTDDGGANQSKTFGFGYYDPSRSETAGVKYWTLRIGNNYVQTTKPVVVNETIFVVLKVDFSNNSTISVYVNPDKSTFEAMDEPNTPTTTANTSANISFKSMHIYADQSNQLLLDEFRFGSTWATVTPQIQAGVVSATISGLSALVTGQTYTYTLAGYSPTIITSPVINTWSSSNPSVIVINPSTGAFTALGIGMANISCKVMNPLGTITSNVISVNVINPILTATISGATSLLTNTTTTYTLVGYTPSSGVGTVISTWRSSNTSIATIDANGILTPVGAGNVGTINVSATLDNGTGTTVTSNIITVTITNPIIGINGVTITGGNAIVNVSSTKQYSLLNYLPLNPTTPLGINWVSSNTTVATIDGTGNLRALANGLTTISLVMSNIATTVTSNMYTVTVVTPIIPVASSTISGANAVITGTTTTFSLVGYSPSNATATVSTTWYTSNSAIATINGSGILTAISPGSVNVFAVHNNPANTTVMSNIISVTVSNPIVALVSSTISGASSVSVGSTIQFSVDGYSPINATNPVSEMWYTSNTAIATISGSGLLTGLSNGSVDVFVISNNAANTTILSNMITVSVAGTANTTTGVSVTSNELENISLYPNPVTSILTIDANEVSTITLFNNHGQLIESKVASKTTFDLATSPSGIYFVLVNKNGILKRLKVVKN